MHKNARQRHFVRGFGGAVFVAHGGYVLAVAHHFGDLRVRDDAHVGQGLQFLLQHGIGFEHGHEFEERDVLDDAGQVDGGFHARVAAANHGHGLAFEQGAVAVGAEGHAAGFVLRLTGYAHFAPARAGGQHHGLGFEGCAVGQCDFGQIAGLGRRLERRGCVRAQHVHAVVAHVCLQGGGELGAFGFLHGDQVFDA